MQPDLEFRADLYKGTAQYYDRYRKPYPEALFEHLFESLSRRSGASGRGGRLLDLACGTGQIAIPLATRFDSVVAVDQEPESVAFARAKAADLGIGNVEWVAGSVETVGREDAGGVAGAGDLGVGGVGVGGAGWRFDVITVGNAFHRLRRAEVASRMRSWLVPGGCVALMWGDMPWVGDLGWQKALMQLFVDWVNRMGVKDRVPVGFEEAMEQLPHDEILRRAGFDYTGRFEFSVEHEWSVDELTGFMFSTSLLNRAVLGDRAGEFAADMAARLRAVEPVGVLRGPTGYAYELAFAPAR